ncbi:hypothetical protein [Pantoea sp. FN0305]|uniref:hypothetical protein n=1 Tax=Pantoea sp. FN0305 TaxID=3418559 RepID=UPI003CE75370
MARKKSSLIFSISYLSTIYIVTHSSLRVSAPCQQLTDILAALLIFLGVNKSCYLLTAFYHWYKGTDEKTKT